MTILHCEPSLVSDDFNAYPEGIEPRNIKRLDYILVSLCSCWWGGGSSLFTIRLKTWSASLTSSRLGEEGANAEYVI